MDTTARPSPVVSLNDINDSYNVNDDDDSSENGDDEFISDGRDDDCASGDDICCEKPVHAKYHFKAGHRERHMGENPWFAHNATTGLSTCSACHSIPNAKGRNPRCKLRDGTLVESKHFLLFWHPTRVGLPIKMLTKYDSIFCSRKLTRTVVIKALSY